MMRSPSLQMAAAVVLEGLLTHPMIAVLFVDGLVVFYCSSSERMYIWSARSVVMVLIERGDEEVLTTQVDCSNQGMCRRSSKERGEEKSDGGVVF